MEVQVHTPNFAERKEPKIMLAGGNVTFEILASLVYWICRQPLLKLEEVMKKRDGFYEENAEKYEYRRELGEEKERNEKKWVLY